jgi:hypothetical protein
MEGLKQRSNLLYFKTVLFNMVATSSTYQFNFKLIENKLKSTVGFLCHTMHLSRVPKPHVASGHLKRQHKGRALLSLQKEPVGNPLKKHWAWLCGKCAGGDNTSVL